MFRNQIIKKNQDVYYTEGLTYSNEILVYIHCGLSLNRNIHRYVAQGRGKMI